MDPQLVSQILGWIPASLHGVAVWALIYAVRLRDKVEAQGKEIERIEAEMNASRDKIWEKIDAVQIQLTAVLQGLARVEGKLDSK